MSTPPVAVSSSNRPKVAITRWTVRLPSRRFSTIWRYLRGPEGLMRTNTRREGTDEAPRRQAPSPLKIQPQETSAWHHIGTKPQNPASQCQRLATTANDIAVEVQSDFRAKELNKSHGLAHETKGAALAGSHELHPRGNSLAGDASEVLLPVTIDK